jgi:hypothetical protein
VGTLLTAWVVLAMVASLRCRFGAIVADATSATMLATARTFPGRVGFLP